MVDGQNLHPCSQTAPPLSKPRSSTALTGLPGTVPREQQHRASSSNSLRSPACHEPWGAWELRVCWALLHLGHRDGKFPCQWPQRRSLGCGTVITVPTPLHTELSTPPTEPESSPRARFTGYSPDDSLSKGKLSSSEHVHILPLKMFCLQTQQTREGKSAQAEQEFHRCPEELRSLCPIYQRPIHCFICRNTEI